MENKIAVEEKTTVNENRWIITKDGIKMTREEWLDIVNSERN